MEESIENLVAALNFPIRNYGEAFLKGAIQTKYNRFAEADLMLEGILENVLRMTSPFYLWETIEEEYMVGYLNLNGSMKPAYKIFGREECKVYRTIDLGAFKGGYTFVGDFPTLLEAKLGAVTDYAKCMRNETV